MLSAFPMEEEDILEALELLGPTGDQAALWYGHL